jgi:hypothetical protein
MHIDAQPAYAHNIQDLLYSMEEDLFSQFTEDDSDVLLMAFKGGLIGRRDYCE